MLVARVCLHRLRGLSALTTETKAELTDALNVSAVLTSQNDPFQCLADRVHESSLLSERGREFARKDTRKIGHTVRQTPQGCVEGQKAIRRSTIGLADWPLVTMALYRAGVGSKWERNVCDARDD